MTNISYIHSHILGSVECCKSKNSTPGRFYSGRAREHITWETTTGYSRRHNHRRDGVCYTYIKTVGYKYTLYEYVFEYV